MNQNLETPKDPSDRPLRLVYTGPLCKGSEPEPWFTPDHPSNLADGWEVRLAPLKPEHVGSYLRDLGYHGIASTSSPDEARYAGLTLQLDLWWHSEQKGHTWYAVGCHLVAEEEPTTPNRHWTVERRLVHFRELLHDPVKSELGSRVYAQHFGDTPFASHGAPVGTSDRVKAWLQVLANLINNQQVPAQIAARTLRFLEAQSIDEATSQSRSSWK